MPTASHQERLRQNVQHRASAVSPLNQPSLTQLQSTVQGLYKVSQLEGKKSEVLKVSTSTDSRPHPKPTSGRAYDTTGIPKRPIIVWEEGRHVYGENQA